MDIKKIEKVIGLAKKHDLAELEVEHDGLKIKAKFINGAAIVSVPAAPSFQQSTPTAAVEKPSSEKSTPQDENKLIRSPLVGTFYGSPSPDAEAFVKPGSKVKKGQTLCIIEAMKIMNEIEAEKDCIIKEIIVNNQDAIEFNQPLFITE